MIRRTSLTGPPIFTRSKFPFTSIEQSANQGRVKMVDCEVVPDTAYGRDPLGGYGTHEISYGSQRSNIASDIIGYSVPEQHIGRALIEMWDTNPKRGGEWTCRDLCEVWTTGPPTVKKNVVSLAVSLALHNYRDEILAFLFAFPTL